MKVYLKKVDGLVLPKRGTSRSTGYDIVATSDPKIVGMKFTSGPIEETGEVGNKWCSIDYIQYETNLYAAPATQTHDIKIYPRSSISKYNMGLANCVPIIDNDYRGMILLRFNYLWQPEDFVIENSQIVGRINESKIFKKGEAIAQLTLSSVIEVEFELVDDLSQTARGEGGFGSTDTVLTTPDQPSHLNMMRLEALKKTFGNPSVVDQVDGESTTGKVHPKPEILRIDSNLSSRYITSPMNIQTPHGNSYLEALKSRESQITNK